MNDLNYLLLAGTLKSNPVYNVTENRAVCTFEINSKRHNMAPDGRIQATMTVTAVRVKTSGFIAEACRKFLRAGRGVRVVGRLISDTTGLCIEAEHVEIQPVKKGC